MSLACASSLCRFNQNYIKMTLRNNTGLYNAKTKNATKQALIRPSVKKQKHGVHVWFFAEPSAWADNPYLDFDYSGYYKSRYQIIVLVGFSHWAFNLLGGKAAARLE